MKSRGRGKKQNFASPAQPILTISNTNVHGVFLTIDTCLLSMLLDIMKSRIPIHIKAPHIFKCNIYLVRWVASKKATIKVEITNFEVTQRTFSTLKLHHKILFLFDN